MSQDIRDILINRKEAAEIIGVSPTTLAVWDCTKRYDLNPIKIGKLVRYRRSRIEQFLSDLIAGC